MLREFFVNETPKLLFKQFGLIHNLFILSAIIGVILVWVVSAGLYMSFNKI